MGEFDFINERNRLVKPSAEETDMPERELIDNEKGVSQESLEGLRAEFISLGGIVTELPEISSVRDFTQIYIPKLDGDSKQLFDRYQALDGKWYRLPDTAEHDLHAEGSSEQYMVGTVMTIVTQNVAVEILEGWTNHHLHNMLNGAGVFTITVAGDYQIHWSLSLVPVSPNKDFAAGIMIDGIEAPIGWAHLTLGASTDTGNMSSLSLKTLRGGQKVSIGILNHTDTTNVEIEHASFSVIRIR
jgi:hypothetical protein